MYQAVLPFGAVVQWMANLPTMEHHVAQPTSAAMRGDGVHRAAI